MIKELQLTYLFYNYRDSLYRDIKLNDTLCERYQANMNQYERKVLKKLDKVMTASSDIGA